MAGTIEFELGPQSLAAIRGLTEALRGLKGIPAENNTGLMNRREAARFLGISLSTLGEWVRAGVLPVPVELSERNQRWRKSDLMEFAKRRGAA